MEGSQVICAILPNVSMLQNSLMRDHLLAIDNGTQSVRALIFDLRGNLVAKSQVPLQPYFSRQPGWAEQNPEYYWSAVCQACQELWAKSPVPKEAVAGVAVTTQRSTVINVDRQGKPLRPAIVWLDQRRTEGLRPLGGLWGAGFKLVGMTETVAYIQAEAEANWIRTHEPEVWANTHKYLFLSGYLTHKLTGRFVDSVGCQVGFMPFDFKRLRWASDWDWKWQAVPIRRELLADLVPPTGQLGEITSEAAEATGIPAGLPLIAAAADKACEVIGAGSLDPAHRLRELWHGGHHQQHADALYRADSADPTLPGRRAQRLQPGGADLSRLLDGQLVQDRVWPTRTAVGQRTGHRAGAVAGRAGGAGAAGVDGAGAAALSGRPDSRCRDPKPRAPSSVLAMCTRAPTSTGRCWRGWPTVCARARNGWSDARARPSPICASRAAARRATPSCSSPPTSLACLPSVRMCTRPSGLGAAIDAAVGLKLHADFAVAVKEMTHVGRVFDPDPQTHDLYDNLYRRVYLKLYDRLKPLYKEIREITGYPAR